MNTNLRAQIAAERQAQGLPPVVTDMPALARLARLVRLAAERLDMKEAA